MITKYDQSRYVIDFNWTYDDSIPFTWYAVDVKAYLMTQVFDTKEEIEKALELQEGLEWRKI